MRGFHGGIAVGAGGRRSRIARGYRERGQARELGPQRGEGGGCPFRQRDEGYQIMRAGKLDAMFLQKRLEYFSAHC